MRRRTCPVCRERTQIASGECVCDRCMGRIPSRLYVRLRECFKMREAAHHIWQENLATALKWLRENEV